MVTSQQSTSTWIYIMSAVLYTFWFIAYTYFNPPVWINILGIIATVLFIMRIVRGDD